MFIRTERSIKEFMQFYPIVTALIIINLILWLIYYVIPLPIGFTIYHWGVGHNFAVYHGEYWRLVTPVFLHGGTMHVLFNSFALVLFGPALEQMLGKGKFILAYLLTGIAGNVGTYVIEPMSNIPHLGASGAVYGLFGIYLYMTFFRRDLIDPANAQLVRTIFIIGLILSFIRPNINIAAHIFGFIGGFAIAPIFLKKSLPFSMERNYRKRRSDDGGVQFNPNRWRKKRVLPRNVGKYLFWGLLLILVLLGLVRYF